MSTFPFGNDPANIGSWLGLNSTKSRIWDVAYSGGGSLIIGQHTLIFMGLENLQIGVVSISGAGPSVGVGTKGMTRGGGGTGRVPQETLDRIVDGAENVINETDGMLDGQTLDEADTGLKLLSLMNQNASRIVAEIPFSFHDIELAWGSIYGFNVGAAFFWAQKYWIDMSPNVIAGDEMYFRDKSIYNLDGGAIGFGIGTLHGKWSVDRKYDLWHESSVRALTQHGITTRPFETPDIRPNSTIPNAIHPFLRDLPITGYPIPPQTLNRYFTASAVE